MTKYDPRLHRSRSRKLISDEDLALWRRMTDTLDPLQTPAKSRVIRSIAAELRSSAAPPPLPHETQDSPWLDQSEPPVRPVSKPSTPPTRKMPQLAKFDQRAARRIRSGRIEIEARLDLHGLRQHEAYAALRSFLLSAHARGLRWVLVITGKGGGVHQEDQPLPWHEAERGVLKRNVPRWLAEPELRAVVVSYTTAAIAHGGDGALYVQLRTKRK